MSAERLGGLQEMDSGKHRVVDFLMEHATSELNIIGRDNLEEFRALKEIKITTRSGLEIPTRRGMIPNHRSNADAGTIEYILQSNGFKDIADDLVFLLGMKLKLKRGTTFLAEAFNHIDVSPVGLKDKEEFAEDSVRINRAALRANKEVMDDGKIFVVFGEGTRTRTGEMGPFEPRIAHYFNEPNTYVMPVALYGTETIWPVDKRFLNLVHRGSATVSFGKPVLASDIMEGQGKERYENFASTMRALVEELIPDKYRQAYPSGKSMHEPNR